MTALSQNPTTTSLLLPNRFRLTIKRAPNVDFWTQRVDVPGFSFETPREATPFVDIPQPGDHLSFEDFGFSFLVDSNLSNYLEIYSWLKGLGKPDSFDQYRALSTQPPMSDLGIKSEINVFVLNGAEKPTFRFVFHDAFPFALGKLSFDAGEDNLGRITCNAGFKYSSFDVEPIT